MDIEATATGLTYDDLLAIPEDNIRRDLINGALFVTPSPTVRHQRVVLRLGALLLAHADRHGGEAHAAPLDVYLSHTSVVEPDVLYLGPRHADRVDEARIIGPPDLMIEVSSPSTRRHDLVRKRRLYEEHGVPEYWFVDLERDRIDAYRLDRGGYGDPEIAGRGSRLASAAVAGFAVSVDEVLGD